jgi:acetoin utilization protein AcuB
MLTVRDIMSSPVVTVELDDSLEVVKEIFDHTRFHHLLVIEYGQLFGIISDRDLLRAVSPNIDTAFETKTDAATLKKKAHQVMVRHPITLKSDALVVDAIQIFYRDRITCIPVIDDENHPVGIICWRDLLEIIAKVVTEIPLIED